MKRSEVMQALEGYGNEQTKKTLLRHGAREPFFGVRVGDLKKLQKKIKKNHELSLQLYATGNSDAMYLAALIADENKITKSQLQDWAAKAYWYYLSEFAVAWITAESRYGWELSQQWITSDEEHLASAGWATLSSLATIKNNNELDIQAYGNYLDQVEATIHLAPNRVRYTMNGFVIAVGSCINTLSAKALKVAQTIGKVDVFMGDTSCKVPLATAYINKVIDMGRLGHKKKMARC